MNEKTKKFRQRIADTFIKALQEQALDWKKEWQGLSRKQINASTGKAYKGINQFWLAMMAENKSYTDCRWATFKQIQSAHWKLQKGPKGEQVEYWLPYDSAAKAWIGWDEFRLRQSRDDTVILIAKYYTVFNASCIDGIAALPELPYSEINLHELITTISNAMGVEIRNDGGDRAFYRILEDKIHLPEPQFFVSQYAYNATALHELAHATGAVTRLNRNISSIFGSEDYAFEELIAEISSCFMGEHLNMEQGEAHINNHKAYVQSWIKSIQEKPDTLIKAIREAEKTANYMQYQAGTALEHGYVSTITDTIEVDHSLILDNSDNVIFKANKEHSCKP